jgi:hypothetical protein
MRIPFMAGSLQGDVSRVLLAPGHRAPSFPGPWRVAAVIRISERYSGSVSVAEASRRPSSASRAAPEATVSRESSAPSLRFPTLPET